MIGYRLCKTKTARHPFYLESISINLYTVEELCYFLYHNPFLIDETVVSLKLTRWIAEELGMPETALRMEQAMRKKAGLADCILPVFLSTQYLSAAELVNYRRTLDTLGSVSPKERLKRKGDALAQNGKYAGAIRIYHQAMSDAPDDGKDEKVRNFRAVLWYNIGVVQMQLFEYEEGTEAFHKAWELKREEEYALTYLEALHLTRTDEKYQAEADAFLKETDLPSDEIKKRVEDVIGAAREKARTEVETENAADPRHLMEKEPEKVLEKIAEEYHLAIGT